MRRKFFNIAKYKKLLLFTLFVLVLLVAIWPLFSPFVFGTADGLAHKFRLVSFVRSVKQGYIRPRWLADQALGYGSPIFLFNYILPYYLIAGLKLVGFSIRSSAAIYQGATIVLSFAFTYLLIKEMWGKTAGLVGAVVYTYAPYHLLTIYLYEGWGEMTAFVFPPLILYLTTQLKKSFSKESDKAKRMGIGTIFLYLVFSWLAFILSHNVSVLLYVPILIMLAVFVLWEVKNGIIIFISSFLTGSILSAFFTIPAVFLNHLTAYPALIIKEMGMRLNYFKPIWFQIDTAISTVIQGIAQYQDFTIGLPLLLLIIIFPIILIFLFNSQKTLSKKRKLKMEAMLPILVYFLFIVCLFMSIPASDFIWRKFPGIRYIVYPFRFLHPATFLGSLTIAYISRKAIWIVVLFVILAIISGFPYTKAWVEIFPFDDQYFSQIQTFSLAPGTLKNMATSEFLPKTADLSYILDVEQNYLQTKKIPAKFEFESEAEIVDLSVKAEDMWIIYQSELDNNLTVNSFYFPNWEAYINGSRVSLDKDKEGRMRLAVPSGKHKVRLRFGFSRLEKSSNLISLAGVILLVGELLWLRKKYHPQKPGKKS